MWDLFDSIPSISTKNGVRSFETGFKHGFNCVFDGFSEVLRRFLWGK